MYTKHMKYKLIERKMLADQFTPVSLFLKLRQKYHQVLLLESTDYSSKENSQSFICFDVVEGIKLIEDELYKYKHKEITSQKIEKTELLSHIQSFINHIDVDNNEPGHGVFGYSCYDSVAYFETIKLDEEKPKDAIPTMRYDFYKYVIVFDHYHESLTIKEYLTEDSTSNLDAIEQMLRYQDNLNFSFDIVGEETSNITPEKYMQNIRVAKEHLQRGDIFQVVLSRRFEQEFTGDPFNVYRTLRSINPSPYLYYFDYGNFRIFGSSPEAEVVIKEGKAEIHPIAGTFKRTGEHATDLQRAQELKEDPKENAEHVMLVDLARNDLSRFAKNVTVKKYKEIQYFSHVIHLTSLVEGQLENMDDALNVFATTFPAGTLSGAPKYKAMQIIDKLESTHRGFYGGALGMLGLNGDINHAIIIRSFLAINNTLKYQAGAGIVISSDEQKELEEVNNKLGALKSAVAMAVNL
ncbi:MAG: anthranilate synthase component I family protein [Saprospiraceae bacterium]|nr:anthranilate synthase component I family protein [Bacteroidia bacterium]NNL93471.1 anthranilate synthase component I family protein [Saprospiraceae bacterium]